MSRSPGRGTVLPPPPEEAAVDFTIPNNESDASRTWNAILETAIDTVRPPRVGGQQGD